MNREIKFRVWDIGQNKMFNPDGCIHIEDYDRIFKLIMDFRIEKYGNINDNPLDCIFLEYTGMKDKIDVEIYEGDIMSDMIVTMCDGSWILSNPVNDQRKKDALEKLKNSGDRFSYHHHKASVKYLTSNLHMSVVGNIFENPDLVKL
jgi:uncharacterized phage protein (TIGR01671 family)